MRSVWLIGGVLAACTPKVEVPVAGNPAVALPSRAVAVVAAERSCQPVADALVQQIWTIGLRVDPRAPLRLEIALCGDDVQVGVEQLVASTEPGEVHRRTEVQARAHALMVVRDEDGVQAHLIGTGRHQAASTWDVQRPLPALGRTARALAMDDVALDLTQQLAPVPTMVARKVWPNARGESPRGLTTRAVLAEQQGDLVAALAFATQAYRERPSARAAAYLTDLERRRTTDDIRD